MDTRLNKTIAQLEAHKAVLNTNTIRQSDDLTWLTEAVDDMNNQVATLPQAEEIRRSVASFDHSDEELRKKGMRRIINAVKSLKNTLSAMIDMAARLDDSTAHSVKIKFKSDLTLKTVWQRLARIEELVSPLISHEDIGGDLKVTSAAEGSVVLVLDLQTARASELLGSTISSAMQIRDAKASSKIQFDEITQLKLQKETIADLENAMAQRHEATLDNEAKAIWKKYHRKSKDKDQLSKIRTAVENMAKELSKIQDIEPSARAPEKVKTCYPG